MTVMSALKCRRQLGVAVGLALSLVVSAPAQEAALRKLNAQASELYRQAKYAEAVRVAQDALKVAEKTFGNTHREVAAALSNLAEYQRAQGNCAEAESLLTRALAIDQKLLGNNHPDVATDLNNLALLRDNLGRRADAEQLYRRALAIDEKSLGPGHPDVATDLNNLA